MGKVLREVLNRQMEWEQGLVAYFGVILSSVLPDSPHPKAKEVRIKCTSSANENFCPGHNVAVSVYQPFFTPGTAPWYVPLLGLAGIMVYCKIILHKCWPAADNDNCHDG